ncbi:MAG: hypothetical protein AAGD25_21395 [Cyanobacteria bacterium P01_F01_bin.150]
MIHGLMWFPLLAIFIVLAWAGWNEYQKVETYRVWATGADRAKYDIRAALIQKNQTLIWGTPSRSGILSQKTLPLSGIDAVNVRVDGVSISTADSPPSKGSTITLELIGRDQKACKIPFTDVDLAMQWAKALKQDTNTL